MILTLDNYKEELGSKKIFKDGIDWSIPWTYSHYEFSDDFICGLADKLDWDWTSTDQKLSVSIMEQFIDRIRWQSAAYGQYIPESLLVKIPEFCDDRIWGQLCLWQQLPESFMDKYADKLYWYAVSKEQKLSEDFMERHINKLHWDEISRCQQLSEAFIERHADLVTWWDIKKFQKLSECFVEKHKRELEISSVAQFQKLSPAMLEKYNIEISKDNWLYKSSDWILEQIKECGLYEIVDDSYVIAYKGAKRNSVSVHSAQYRYEVGKTYESPCDCRVNNTIDNFGISAFSRHSQRNKVESDYYLIPSVLFKVRINKEDIGVLAINKKHDRIRARKITVLEQLR